MRWYDMKGQPNRDSNPVPPSQGSNHSTNWANEAGSQISTWVSLVNTTFSLWKHMFLKRWSGTCWTLDKHGLQWRSQSCWTGGRGKQGARVCIRGTSIFQVSDVSCRGGGGTVNHEVQWITAFISEWTCGNSVTTSSVFVLCPHTCANPICIHTVAQWITLDFSEKSFSLKFFLW